MRALRVCCTTINVLSKWFNSTQWHHYRDLNTSVRRYKNMDKPIVSIPQGKLKGSIKQLSDKSTYYSFKGIPYAQPPVGKLRFMAPQPPKPWSGIYDATFHRGVCPQVDMSLNIIVEGNEDCLFLNVYSKSLQQKKPVMFFIHGGGFMYGSGDEDFYGPDYLLQHDGVVLVTINYRLEALGFLNLDIPEVPGNAGMKDQVAALKWVKNNIQHFGGDPNDVTIFGESAGGVSVTNHMLSPMSKGLFHKAIAQSGVSLNYWGFHNDVKQKSFDAGKVLGKDTKDPYELLDYLQSLKAKDFIKICFKVMSTEEKYSGIALIFTPVVEKKFRNVEAFLDKDPLDTVISGNFNAVPLLTGYNSAEGIVRYQHTLKNAKLINDNMHYRLPRDLALYLPDHFRKQFGDRVKKFYFDCEDITKNKEKVCELESDCNFAYAIHRFLYFYAKNTRKSCYMYEFDYDTDINFPKRMLGTKLKGASHADELFYLFSSNATKDIYDDESNEDIRKKVGVLTKLWTDFAKTGNPTPDTKLGFNWSPYTPNSKAYLNISETINLQHYADAERMEFWNKMYKDAGLYHMSKSSL